MIAFTHLAAGAAGGALVNSCFPEQKIGYGLIMGFAAGVISHIVLDSFAHWEYSSVWPWPTLLVEISIVFMVIYSVRYNWAINLILFFGMSGAALPDVLLRISVPPAPAISRFIHQGHGYFLSGSSVSLGFQVLLGILAILAVKLLVSQKTA